MPKAEELERLAQSLKNIASAGGAQGTKAERVLEKVETREARTWIEKFTNRERPAQQEDDRRRLTAEAERDNYKFTSRQSLTEAKRNLQSGIREVQTAGRQIPTYLEDYARTPLTASGSRLIERITRASNELRDNPDFLVRQAAKAYWGTNWLELTDEAATYQRNLIDETVNQAQKLAVNASGYEHFAALREEGAFWDMIDDRPDIYRTQRLEKLKKNASQEEKDKHNALEEELREFQIRIDNRHRYGISPEEELRLLLEERDKLSDLSVGRNAQLSNREVDLYLKKLSKKIEKLRVHLEQERQVSVAEAEVGGRRVGPQNPYEERVASRVQSAVESIRKSMAVLTPKEMDEIREALTSTTNKAIAEEIFALPDKITRQQLEDLFAKLKSTNAYDEIINSLSQGGRRRLGTREVWGVIDKEAETILRLQNFLTSKVFNLSEFSISSSVWGRPEGAVAAEAIATLQLGDIGEHGSEKLDKIFFQTLLRSADTDPHAVWDKAYDIFKQSDRHIFYALLETRLGELGLSMDQIKQVVGIYTQHYELKEIHHNLISIIETRQEGARETVQKYLGSYKDEYADFMFDTVRGVRTALSLQESVLERIAADNDDHLPPWMMDRVGGKDSVWTATYKDVFDNLRKQADFNKSQTNPQTGLTEYLDAQNQVVASMNAEGEILDVAGKEISKKELLKKAAPKFEDLQELRGMEDWQRDVAIENAYGFSIASMELPMKLGRFKGGRAYSRVWGETLKFDFVRGVLLKFKTPQPGVAILYMALTGDVRGALEIRKAGYTVGAFIEQYSKTGDENTIAALRNWFGISSRVGPSSRWGIKFGEHGWTRELAEHQGFGLDVNDAKYKIEDRYKQQLERRFEHIKNAGERDIQVRKEMAKLKETIEEEVRGEIKASLIRGGDITPLSIVRFWVRDKEFYKNMNWKANPNTLVDRRRDLLAEIVGNDIVQECLRGRDEHGNLLSPLVVHASVFRHGNDTLWVTNLKRLWIANTANEDIEFPKQHLVGAELERVQAAEVAVREKIIGAVEGDLELVQQKALLRVQRELGSGATREQMQGRNKLLDEDFEVISDDVRRTHAHTYYDKIRKISEDKGFYDRLAERVATGKENYLISTVDLPWNKVRWKDMGGGGFVQAWMDANATMKGEQGVYNYFRGHTGQPKWEELAAILDKDVFSNVMSYDPTIAQRASHTLYKGSLIFYKEHPWATRLGPIGDFVWGASWFSRFLEERKAYGSMVSPAKMFIGYDATHLGPNNLHRAIRIGNDKNLFAKDPIPLDWGAGEDYTALSLEKEVGATPRDMAAEVLFYLFPFGLPLGMVLEGGREQIEEEKKK